MSTTTMHRPDHQVLGDAQISQAMRTQDGLQYHVVRRTATLASVIVNELDNLEFDVVSEGGVKTVEFEIIDTLIGLGKDVLDAGVKLLKGECKVVNHQTATFDSNGNMTSFSNTTSLDCSSPA